MRIPAEQFLTFRAYGAPPIVIALAAQGAFRGLMDTKTLLAEMDKVDHVNFCNYVFLMSKFQDEMSCACIATSVIYTTSSVVI